MKSKPLRLGISACFSHANPMRALFKGKTLLYLEETLCHWIQQHHAIPYLIPTALKGTSVERFFDGLDGLVLQGGVDLAPQTYGEEPLKREWEGDAVRDAYEISLVQEAFKLNLPVFGICRGAQLINVAFGGTLYQDIKDVLPEALLHRDWDHYDELTHEIEIQENSLLSEIYGGSFRATINTVHHQAVKDLGKDLKVQAISPEDGIIEAIAHSSKEHFVLGVQWHPEWRRDHHIEQLDNSPLLNCFMEACLEKREQRGKK